MTFGKLLQKLRKEQGLTLKELSEKVGSSKGYLSGIENEKVNPPSEKFVRKLARILGIDEIEFLKMAYLEKVPAVLRAEFEGTQPDVPTAPAASVAPQAQLNKIQLLNTVGTGYPTELSKGQPVPLVSGDIHLPQLNPRQHVAVTVTDDSMIADDQRGFGEGDLAILHRTEEPLDGDAVFVIYRTRDGREAALRQILQKEGENLVLQPLNKKHSLHFLNQDDIEAIFRVVGKVAFYMTRNQNSVSHSM